MCARPGRRVSGGARRESPAATKACCGRDPFQDDWRRRKAGMSSAASSVVAGRTEGAHRLGMRLGHHRFLPLRRRLSASCGPPARRRNAPVTVLNRLGRAGSPVGCGTAGAAVGRGASANRPRAGWRRHPRRTASAAAPRAGRPAWRRRPVPVRPVAPPWRVRACGCTEAWRSGWATSPVPARRPARAPAGWAFGTGIGCGAGMAPPPTATRRGRCASDLRRVDAGGHHRDADAAGQVPHPPRSRR